MAPARTRATSGRSRAALAAGSTRRRSAPRPRAGLTATNFTLAEGGTGFEAWGNGDGSADLNYGFDATGGGLYDFRMLGEFTDDWDVNEIGWYELGNPETRHTIFGADAAVGADAQVCIPTNFGFYYLNTSGNGEIFYTQSQFNTLGATKQQFAAFQLRQLHHHRRRGHLLEHADAVVDVGPRPTTTSTT